MMNVDPHTNEGAPDLNVFSRKKALLKLKKWFTVLLAPTPHIKFLINIYGILISIVVFFPSAQEYIPYLKDVSYITVIFFVLSLVLGIICSNNIIYTKQFRKMMLLERSNCVCVVYPDACDDTADADHAVYEDGKVQREGFSAARDSAAHSGGRTGSDVLWCGMEAGMQPDVILDKMKRMYRAGATYFVMTMSGKIKGIKQDFITWRKQCIELGMPAPVLIATVTSAAEIADIDNGIVRWYVRSQEESSALAEHLKTKNQIRHIVRFLIEGKAPYKSPFAQTAGQMFVAFFNTENDKHREYEVSTESAENFVDAWIQEWFSWPPDIRNTTAAFVAGYGKMLGTTIDQLKNKGFTGPIACTSTITHPGWQPSKEYTDDNIFTVLPVLYDRTACLSGQDRNIVRLFAKNTLLRVLALRAISKDDSNKFLADWRATEGNVANEIRFKQTFDDRGDIKVEVQVVTLTFVRRLG